MVHRMKSTALVLILCVAQHVHACEICGMAQCLAPNSIRCHGQRVIIQVFYNVYKTP